MSLVPRGGGGGGGGGGGEGGGGSVGSTSIKLFLFEKKAFVDKLTIEPTIFFMGKILISLKLFSGHFYGQSFIKTALGPLIQTIIV